MPRILCLSDIHDDFERYSPSALPDADAVLVAGDFTEQGNRGFDELSRARAWMQSLAQRYQHIFFVCGNHDFGMGNTTFQDAAGAWGDERVIGVEREYANCAGVSLYGASLSPCFNAPRMEQHWCRMTGSRNKDAAEWSNVKPVDIVLSHCPPQGVLDAGGGIYDRVAGKWNPESLGSPGLRKYLRQHRPKLVVCGHIHEAWGTVRVRYPGNDRTTLVVNCAQHPVLVTVEGNHATV